MLVYTEGADENADMLTKTLTSALTLVAQPDGIAVKA